MRTPSDDEARRTMSRRRRVAAGSALALGAVVAYDVTQRSHAILRNFPIVGHFRYILETFGPELRQYIVTSNNEERPFSRDERSWVYASSKRETNTIGFGSDNEMENGLGYLIVKPDAFPSPPPHGRRERLARPSTCCPPARSSARCTDGPTPSARSPSSTSAA